MQHLNEHMQSNPVEINLSVQQRGDSIVAHLLFFNSSPKTYFLDRFTICSDGKFTRDVFKIVDENDIPVHYVGFMVKRLVMAEHFIALEPGAALKTTVFINTGYVLKKGKRYVICYTTFNPGYQKIQDYMKIESNAVEITYE